jgi:glyoxylase-like metal-dependent hydrolase (beta-lactamase superfamily II)
MTLLQITDHIWVFPYSSMVTQPAVGIIVTPTQTVLIDAGNSPAHGHQIMTALEEIYAPPIRHIIYTHHHWDHVLGAQTFNSSVIAHIRCYELLKSLADLPWSAAFVEAELRVNPLLHARYNGMKQALRDWSEVRFVLPTMTFSEQMMLCLDGITLCLMHVGGQHAEDSIVVHIPEAQVTFLGDCFYPPPFHLRTQESAPDWSMLARLLNDQSQVYVAGHEPPINRKEIQALLDQTDK